MAFFRNLCMMMARVKARQLPPLAPKLSVSSASEPKRKTDGNCLTNFAVICVAVSFGVTVISGNLEGNFLVCIIISAASATLSGLCLAEFLTNHAQNGYSVYSCAYHSVCEFAAYVIGWTWLLSLASCFASICMSLSRCVDELAGHQLSSFMRTYLSPECPDLLSAVFAVSVVLVSVTGVSHSYWWFLVSLILSLACATVSSVLLYVDGLKVTQFSVDVFRFNEPVNILSSAAVCSSVFTGCHSALRLPRYKVNRKLRCLLSPVNIICAVLVFVLGLPFFNVRNSNVADNIKLPPEESSYMRSTQISFTIASLSIMALEYYHTLLLLVQDMSGDGLLFRCLSKQWKPFCHKVVVLRTEIVVALAVAVMTLAVPLSQVLMVAAVVPLFIGLVVSVTILLQRYGYRDSWRYEPMLPSGSETRYSSHKRTTEFLPPGGSQEVRPEEGGQSAASNSDDEDSSETDIDAVVQEYKEKVRLTKLSHLNSSSSETFVQEPTTSTSFKSKVLVSCYAVNCVILGITLTVAARADAPFDYALLSAIVLTLLMSLVFLCLLNRLPQNKPSTISSARYPSSAPLMPWTGGAAILMQSCLLIHLTVDTWHITLFWNAIGLIFYFTYGIRNSTAAASFYALTTPTQVSMQPFPKNKASCRVIFPQKRLKNKMAQST